ncbi:hypothetical protein OG698_39545 [Streptomyces sp. NBC_01003]|uniref:hypothetical protein n=1 Tax=Streptomyces sp. NBC_01003 TaxID=2903714 RepID=UPI00386F5896|nr:hypothetical protein OG698_39545 [Streptomyces sp. NBC_01003]
MRTSTNPELLAAWATVPDVATAQERHAEAVRLRRAFPSGATPTEALTGVQDAAIATLTSTGKWPSDFARKAAKAHADAVVWHAENAALRRAEEMLKYAAEVTRDSTAPDVLAHLDGRLTEILTAAKDASTALGDVTTAEAAIDAGGDALDAWRALTALLSDLRNVRSAQWYVLRSVSDDDERARLRTWSAQGHGEVRGVRLEDVPPHVRDATRTGAYPIAHLVWLAHSGAGYVPTSFGDLEADVVAASEPVTYDDLGPLRDFNPRVTQIPAPRQAQVYPHSSTPHIDHSQPTPTRPTVNATVPDPSPLAYSY